MTPWTVAHQAPLSTEFSWQGYWTGLPFPSPGDLPNPGIEPRFHALQADALPSEPPGKPSLLGKDALKLVGEKSCLVVWLLFICFSGGRRSWGAGGAGRWRPSQLDPEGSPKPAVPPERPACGVPTPGGGGLRCTAPQRLLLPRCGLSTLI